MGKAKDRQLTFFQIGQNVIFYIMFYSSILYIESDTEYVSVIYEVCVCLLQGLTVKSHVGENISFVSAGQNLIT